MNCGNTIPDHPVIQNLIDTGWPSGHEPETPRCPVCGEETSRFAKNKDNEIVGCIECVRIVSIFEEDNDERALH